MSGSIRVSGIRPRRVVASTAAARVDPGTRIFRLSALCYGIGGTVFALLALGDALSETQYFEPCFTAAGLALLPLPAVVAVLALWAPRRVIRGVLLFSVVAFAALLALSLVSLTGPDLPDGRSLWLLDIMAVTTTAAALSCSPRVTWAAVGGLCVGGGAIRFIQSDYGLLGIAVMDTLNLLLVSSLFAALSLVTVKISGALDTALRDTLREAAHAAGSDARRLEQQRIDGMIHDDILATLLSASKGVSAGEVARSAQTAVRSIQSIGEQGEDDRMLDAEALEILLRARVTAIAEGIVFEFVADESFRVGSVVGSALSEATGEALRNSLRHAAGTVERADDALPRATTNADVRQVTRTVTIVATADAITVRIADDGIGFTLDVPSRRGLGIQTSIISRMQIVGGTADIVSQPGLGTVVELRWAAPPAEPATDRRADR